MTDCPFQLNVDGFYECPDCHWVYKRKSDKPPRRNCPKAPDVNTPEYRETIKSKMLAELTALVEEGRTQNTLTAITEQLDVCVTCKRFEKVVCTARGSACRQWKRWREALATFACPCSKFKVKP